MVRDVAEKMCGKNLIVPGGNPTGYLTSCVLIMEKLEHKEELYLGIKLCQKNQCPVITYSKHGGMTLEHIQKYHPESLFEIKVDILKGLDFQDL